MGNPDEEAAVSPKQHESVPLVEVKKPSEAADESTAKKKADDIFTGLTKEELDQFAKDPFWRRLRMVIFLAFWVVWFGMLAAVIIIIVVSPKCPPRPDRQFWQNAHYRLQIQSFAPDPEAAKNSTASPMGSVSGFKAKLDYLRKTLGVNNYIVGGLLEVDGATGCSSDFSKMDARFGSEAEFAALTKQGRKKGFNFIVEIDVSQADPKFRTLSKLKDSVFIGDTTKFLLKARDGQSAWRDSVLHACNSKCNSLNVSDAAVRDKIKAALSAWLDRGVSGFLLNNAAYLQPAKTNEESKFLFTDEGCSFVRHLREFLDQQASERGRELALIVDPGNTGAHPSVAQLSKFVAKGNAHAVVNPGLGNLLKEGKRPDSILKAVQLARNQTGFASVSNWPYLQRLDELGRVALGLTLPGVPIVYYGQELGMTHVPSVEYATKRSFLASAEAEDQSETPMQWANSESAGWLADASAKLTWISGLSKRSEDIRLRNVRRLGAAGHPRSALNLTVELLGLIAKAESLQWGVAELLPDSTDTRLVITRKAVRFPTVVIVVNMDDKDYAVSLRRPTSGTLKVAHGAGAASYALGAVYNFNSLFVPPKAVLVFVGNDAD